MSRPKRKILVDSQKELVRLAYEKKTIDDSSSSRKIMDLPFVSSIVTPSVVLTPQMSTHLPHSSLGQLVPFGQCTPFGQSSQSPLLECASSIPYPREPGSKDCNHFPYLKNMTSPEEDGILVGSVDEVVTSFNKMHLQYGFMALHFTDSVCKLATEVSHCRQRILVLNNTIKSMESQIQERDVKLMERDNSIRVHELDGELLDRNVNELKSEKAQLEARSERLERKIKKRDHAVKRLNKRNANVYLRGYMDAQTEVREKDPSFALD
ncbi:hypothetical protein Ddye_012199 [Dipteronia dyeriana]|uniref:Uncharacterized protein n=1 Tax=Dipteronia dyeriana TaxID=168575 RepID=A0AAD9X440_9ROSI|nr:hypothetical protein Ddye_012199 [Dipteronia dyeriana]